MGIEAASEMAEPILIQRLPVTAMDEHGDRAGTVGAGPKDIQSLPVGRTIF